MLISEWVGMGTFSLIQIGFYVGLIKYINAQDGKVYSHVNKSVDRVYERFDENKKQMEDSFVRKDLCAVMHQTNTENLVGVEGRISEALGKLDKKVDENFKVVIDLMKK